MMPIQPPLANCAYRTKKGLSRSIVEQISSQLNEPGWMTDCRLRALELFEHMPMPSWGADLSELDPYDIFYFLQPLQTQHTTWDDVPDKIKTTFEKLGIPQAEQKFLAGVGAQYESQVVYKKLRREWQERGVVFCDMTEGLATHPEIFKRYFSTVVPAHDNKFAALNSAVWSGGSFVYVPAGVSIDMPLQAYFRINSAQMGQFERTLIVAEPSSEVHYVEGCSAPLYRSNSLHSAVVEVVALPGAKVRYTTIQNWSNNVYNLVTKRAIAHERSQVIWVDGNFGSKVTMKYPCIVLQGEYAKGQIISIAVAGSGQQQDAGAKIIHLAPHTTSQVIAKSISKHEGRSSYRGLLKIIPRAHHVRATVRCDALLLNKESQSDTYPTMQIDAADACVEHEASVSSVSQEQLFYLQSRGLSVQVAAGLIVNGFVDVFVKELPMEYAIEINRLIAHEMEGSIG